MASKYLHSLLGGLATSGAVYLVEATLARAGIQGEKTLLDDALLGIFAALAVFFLLSHRDAERELSRQKECASVIAELNHHIRNALQVIVSRTELSFNNPELQEIRNAVNRIDWALREILPRSIGNSGESSGPDSAGSGKEAASQKVSPPRNLLQ